MTKLENFYIQIVKANLVKNAQEDAGNPVSKPEETKDNSLNQSTSTELSSQTTSQSQPATNTVPTAAKPKMLADSGKKPETSNQTTKDQSLEGKTSNENSQTYTPNQTYSPQQAYKKSNNLSDLVSLGIDEIKQNYIEAVNYYTNINIKNKILNKFSDKKIIIKKIGSDKKTLINLNEKNYDYYVKLGMEKLYLPLTKNQKQITIKAKDCDLYKIKQAFLDLYKDDYINKCSIIKNKNELYITCSTEKDIRALPVFIIEKIEKIAGVFEVPTENRLCVVPESIFKGEECFML